jgi:hypothetical protein
VCSLSEQDACEEGDADQEGEPHGGRSVTMLTANRNEPAAFSAAGADELLAERTGPVSGVKEFEFVARLVMRDEVPGRVAGRVASTGFLACL